MSFVLTSQPAKPLPVGSIQSPHDPQALIAEATQPHLAAAVYKAFLTLRHAVTDRLVYAGMANGALMTALEQPLTQFRDNLRGTMLYLANAHMQSHTLAARQLSGAIAKASINFDLDTLPQPTQDALDDYDFGLIREVSDDTLQTVSQVIQRGVTQGWSPAKMARQIQGSIGLTATQDSALDNYRTMLETGNPDALTRALRDARSDSTVQASVDGTKKLSPDQIDRLVSRYEEKYLSYRANTIARYESLRATNQGSSDAVQAAIDAGTVDPSQVTTRWKICQDEITCPLCRSIVEIQPQGVPFGSPFQWATMGAGKRAKPQSGLVFIAPAHPSCRCTNSYQIAPAGGAL